MDTYNRSASGTASDGLNGSRLGQLLVERIPALYSAALSGDVHASTVAMRRLIIDIREVSSELAEELKAKLPAGDSSRALRRATFALGDSAPSDPDSRSQLLREMSSSAVVPVLRQPELATLQAFVEEQKGSERLQRLDLVPRRTLFLVGPPGVGKTMTAGWLAHELDLPLFQVELSALVSSYLGRTGQNLREIMDFARANRVVLFLDEFDAIGKRRDDPTDLGELRRVVSVLLKEIEEWPGPSILVAASNFPELVDPAVLRRFQLVVSVQAPALPEVRRLMEMYLAPAKPSEDVLALTISVLEGCTGSELRNIAVQCRRTVALNEALTVDEALLSAVASRATTTAARKRFARAARDTMKGSRGSFANLASLLGVSKATIHNYLAGGGKHEWSGPQVHGARRG